MLQSRSGHCGEEKQSQPLLGLEPLIIQPELSQLHNPEECNLNLQCCENLKSLIKTFLFRNTILI
jgi:hypothetical protein